MKKNVVAVDIGTSKIVTLVAEYSGSRRSDVIAAGVSNYDGFTGKNWNNPAKLNEALKESIEEAAKQCKRKLREVNVGVPGQFTTIFASDVSLELEGTDPVVKPADIRSLYENASKKLHELPGIVVHQTPAWFMVDNGKKTLQPVGLKGRVLRGLITFAVADKFFIEDVNGRLLQEGYKVEGFYSTIAGEAMLCVDSADRDRTAVLIDVGYLTTDVIIVEGDALLYNRTIGFGGGHMTAALSEELNIKFEDAENIKRAYTYNLIENNPEEFPLTSDGLTGQSVKREAVAAVLDRCVSELADQIRDAIANSGVRLGNWSPYFITGGGLCMNKGGKDFLANKLDHAIKEIDKAGLKLGDQNYRSSLGLADLLINNLENRNMSTGNGWFKDFFTRLMNG